MWRHILMSLAGGLLLFACQPEKDPEQNTTETESPAETPPASREIRPETTPLPAPGDPENPDTQKSPSTQSRQTESRPGTTAPREKPEAPPAPVRGPRQTYAEVRPGYRGLALVKQMINTDMWILSDWNG
ncbi:MAG: hypothetical protein HC913_00985 [Microscillaceae bacterium]|nr:hypothetical protein [Microscillaceae bacterium]